MSTSIAFPSFNDKQMEIVAEIGDSVTFSEGETLIPHGQKDYPFFVIESGEIQILEKDGAGETLIATHGPRAFSGDVDMLTGRSAMFTARARTTVSAFRLCATRLRKLLNDCPQVGEMLLEAFQLRRRLLADTSFVGVRVVCEPNTPESSQLQEFFYKNHVPYTLFEAGTDEGDRQLATLAAQHLELPVVRCNGQTVGNPSLHELAECLGINRRVDQQLFDLVIVGAGPAGLAASVYAASEGISVLVIDSVGPGGQAGSSSKIENFIGFPAGISGSDLAGLGYLQALKFGARFIAPITVHSIRSDEVGEHQLTLSTGQIARARCVLVTTGVSYRQLDLPGCRELEGAGVYYAATTVEARSCAESTAVVVGGGNSAGQAAMFLAEHAKQVKLLIRGDDLSKSMSAYLCKRVQQHPRIDVVTHTEVTSIDGDSQVQAVHVRDNRTGQSTLLPCSGLFIFIGAKPHTEWLPKDVLLDEKGYILTGARFFADPSLRKRWPLERTPCDLETTAPGIMAAGDVRSGTTKRCGFAVGDGALAVSCVHQYLSLRN